MSPETSTEVGVDWVDVTTIDELWEGDVVDVEANGEPVLLVHHLGGQIRAFQGICPHQELLLADGGWDEESGILTCHGHNWTFDLHSGTGINPSGCRLYEYPTRRDGDAVLVGVPRDGDRHYNRCTAAEDGS